MHPTGHNPYLTAPKHPNYLRRARHHDYRRPSRYMITITKAAATPALALVAGNPRVTAPTDPDAPHTILTPAGEAIAQALTHWLERYTQIRLGAYIIMPDHLHLCIDVQHTLPHGLSRAIAALMGMTTRAWNDSLPARNHPDPPLPFFSKGFNDRIAYTPERWERMIRYVADNPRRLLIKRLNPDLYLTRWTITTGTATYTASGNIMLLRNPDIEVVRFSRRFSPEEFQGYVAQWHRCVENGGVLISPFIHPREKALKDHALANGGAIIKICDNGFSERDAPRGQEFELMATGRLLLIARTEHNTRTEQLTYGKAQGLNAIARHIAATDWLSATAHISRIHR